MLSSFTIKDFKSYREATLKLAPLTVLIGANASGKSNAIEALRLLSWIAQGNKLGAIRYAVQEEERAIRGTVQDLGFRSRRVFSLACRTTHRKWDHYSISLVRQRCSPIRTSCNSSAFGLITFCGRRTLKEF